jgi:hypothetical protein
MTKKPEEEKTARPFSCGSQYGDWRSRNCDRCAKGYDNQEPQPANGIGPCEIDNAVSMAYLDRGTVTPTIAKRMGYTDPCAYSWECPEFQALGVEVAG